MTAPNHTSFRVFDTLIPTCHEIGTLVSLDVKTETIFPTEPFDSIYGVVVASEGVSVVVQRRGLVKCNTVDATMPHIEPRPWWRRLFRV